MTWLDWLLVAMAIWFVVQGLLKGAVAAVLGALAIVISYVVAAIALPTFGERAAEAMAKMRLVELSAAEAASWGRAAVFAVTFVIAYVVLSLIINILPGGKLPGLQAQVLGVFTGLFKAFVASMALVGFLLASPLSSALSQDAQRSAFMRSVAEAQRTGIQTLQKLSPISFPPVGPDRKF